MGPSSFAPVVAAAFALVERRWQEAVARLPREFVSVLMDRKRSGAIVLFVYHLDRSYRAHLSIVTP